MTNLDHARELLHNSTCTMVLISDKYILRRSQRGIQPLLSLVESGEDYSTFSAADKVVGKAAAMLYILLGIKHIHADVISKPAAELLKSHGTELTCDSLVDYIVNRSGDGKCPMESAVLEVTDPHEGLTAIKEKLNQLTGGNT